MHDVRYAIRIARQNPGSTLAAFVALTLGIGATTAIFSIVNSILLRPLSVQDPDSVIRIFETKGVANRAEISMADYLDWKAHLKSFESLAIYRDSQANLTGVSNPERVRLLLCESTLFPLLGIGPIQGRNFLPQEDQPGHNGVAILSWSYWQNHLGGESALGKKILLDDTPYTVIGILPSNFLLFRDEDLFVPVAFDPTQIQNRRGYHQYSVLGRLRAGISLAQADAELAAFSKSLAVKYPDKNGDVGALGIKLRDSIAGEVRPVLMMLAAAVTCVLLIACGNAANLLLARALARRHEISVRIAVGASRSRLYRQVLTESVLLSFSAALAGTAVAVAVVRVVRSLKNTGIPDPAAITVDWHVMAFALATGIVTGILFGVAPTLGFSNMPLGDALKQSTGRLTASRRQHRLSQLFAALETAIATLLLIESGLLLKSFLKASAINPGFSTAHLLTLQVSLPESRYGRAGSVGPFVQKALEQIRSVPGIQNSAIGTNLPLLGSGLCSILVRGRPVFRNTDRPFVQFNGVSPGYFQTMGIRMLTGRDFNYRDTAASPAVVIVNEALARRFFTGQNPIGQRLAYFSDQPHWKEIIGEVANVRQHGIETGPVPEVFTPLAQDEFKWLAIAARTNADPLSFTKPIEQAVHYVDPELAVFLPRTMDQIITLELGWRAFHTSLLIVFGCIAITLASIGIYAVIAYSVTQRMGEMAVRMALGAASSDVLRMILWQGVSPAFFGSITGAVCALGFTSLISQLLYGIQPMDLQTYCLAVLLLLVVALAAAYFPARRAASVHPSEALRYQ